MLYVVTVYFCFQESVPPLERKSARHASYLVGVVFTLFIGLRWEIGTDWGPYKEFFESPSTNISNLFRIYHFDIGYSLWNILIKNVVNDYSFFIFTTTLVTILFLTHFVNKYSPYPSISLFIFYVSYMLPHFIGGVRRAIALVAVLFFLATLAKKKIGKLAVTFLIIAFLFHRTALICVLALFVPKHLLKISTYCLFLIICIAFGAMQLPILIVKLLGEFLANQLGLSGALVEKMIFYGLYAKDSIPENVNIVKLTSMALIKRSFFVVFFYIYIRKSTNTLGPFFFNLYVTSIGLYTCFIGFPVLQVLSTYFALVDIILVAICLSLTTYSNRLIYLCILFLYGVMQLNTALAPYPELFLPYKSVFAK